MSCSVAIVDAFYLIYLKMFNSSDGGDCLEILKDIKKSMKNVATKHNCDEGLILSYDENAKFLCPCDRKQHIATLTSREACKVKCCLQNQPLPQYDIQKYTVWVNEEKLPQQKYSFN